MNIPYGRQSITEEDIRLVVETLRSDYLTCGPMVSRFEEAFAAYCGTKYAVAMTNATCALHATMLSLGVTSGVRVLTCPITFSSSANCVLMCNGEIGFVDIDPETFTINLDELEIELASAINEGRPYSGVIPVSYAGNPLDVERLGKISKKYNVWIVEDNCHAPGGEFYDSGNKVHKVGSCSFTKASTFSLHPVKHIAAGEGGVVTTNDQDLYENLLKVRAHNMERGVSGNEGWKYDISELGYNYRFPDINAALAFSQLGRLDDSVKKRNQIASTYKRELMGIDGLALPSQSETLHAYHLYVVRTKRRGELYNFLRQSKVFTQVHYFPVHLLTLYRNLGFKEGMFPESEKHYSECLSLPMYPSLTHKEQMFVIEKIKEFFNV